MIRKLGQYRLHSRKVDPNTGKRRKSGHALRPRRGRAAAGKHEREVQYFKRRH